MGVSVDRTFLSFLRQGVAAAIATARSAAGPRASLSLGARVAADASEADVPGPAMALLGPADVIGVQPDQIIARLPEPGARNVPTDEYAFIEFARPDLPWLFTPFAPDAGNRLVPWLCLVVIEQREGVNLGFDGTRWALEFADAAALASQLPDLSQLHAWAHAQVPDPARAEADMRAGAAGLISRIIAPTPLAAGRDYLACLVPTFLAGRRAGLGQTIDPRAGDQIDPAWPASPAAPLTLPVYDHWRFSTGAPEGFEALVRKLRPGGAGTGLGLRPFALSAPGGGMAAPPTPIGLNHDGALCVAVGQTPDPTPRDVGSALSDRLVQDDCLAPPAYGCWHAAASIVDPAPPDWFLSLNLDVPRRIAASLGAQVVQRHQEEFMAAVWEQAGEVLRANRILHWGEAAQAAGRKLHRQRLRVDTGLFAFVAPALAQIAAGPRLSMAGALRSTCLAPAVLSPALTRLLRPRGTLVRRIERAAGYEADGQVRSDPPPVAHEEVLQAIAEGRHRPATVPPAGARLAGPPVKRRLPGAGHIRPGRMPRPLPAPPDPYAAIFAELAQIDARTRPAACAPLDPTLAGQLHAALDPDATLPDRMAARIEVPAGLVTGRTGTGPIMVGPQLGAAASGYLIEQGVDWLLPGIGTVDPDTITVFSPNPQFIEAFMAGLNHEMVRELLWRGFPTDQRCTVFDSFWRNDDRAIPPINRWQGPLGENLAKTSASLTLVLISGQLVQRYPALTLFLQRKSQGGGPATEVGGADTIAPSFVRTAQAGQMLVAFPVPREDLDGYFLVFQEDPRQTRFGPSQALPPASIDSSNAANFARSVARPPVRLFVPASRLIGS